MSDAAEVDNRKREILYQWAAYRKNPNTLTQKELRLLKEQAQKLKVVLK